MLGRGREGRGLYSYITHCCTAVCSVSEKSMFITVKTLTGKEIPIFIEPDAEIEMIKNIVEQKEGIPPPQQRLVFDGEILLDDKSVQDYSITDGAIIHLVLALKGGI